jgi:hypothetical protein
MAHEDDIKGFLNLGDPPFSTASKDAALAELLQAGIPRGATMFTTKEIEVYKPDSEAAALGRCGITIPGACARSETMWIEVHSVTAEAYGWEFRRNWYYRVCFTKRHPVPLAAASKLFASHGSQVRTDGSCACPAPNSSVSSYHVDSPAGLKALIALLKQEHECREAEHRAEIERRYGKL